MTYSVRDRLAYIGKRQDQVRGEWIIYSRGPNQVHILMAPGHIDVQDIIPQTAISVIRYVDFIITSAKIVLPTIGLTKPQRGDTILWEGRLYVATPPSQGDDVYQPTNMYRDRLRVHTVLTTDVETAI